MLDEHRVAFRRSQGAPRTETANRPGWKLAAGAPPGQSARGRRYIVQLPAVGFEQSFDHFVGDIFEVDGTACIVRHANVGLIFGEAHIE